jgi:hypothetical protein
LFGRFSKSVSRTYRLRLSASTGFGPPTTQTVTLTVR